MKTITQEPTSIKEVVPQKHVLPPDTPRIEEHLEANIIKDTTTMLKGLVTSIITTTSQVKVPLALEVSVMRYATWFFNALP